jgi:hypothetical protein
MIDLKKAREKGRLEDFIKEHEKDAPADKERLDNAIDSLAQGKKKPARETSKPDSHER